jgi:uncharacterized protein
MAAGPPRVVLDTNVWLDLWLFNDPRVASLRQALAAGELAPVRSAATDAELREVLARPELFNVPAERQRDLLGNWEALATLVAEPSPVTMQCRDPLDQKFLELAMAAGAALLITKDRDLLKLRKRARAQGVAVLTPAQFPPDRTTV